MLSIFSPKPRLWMCLVVLPAVLMSCEHSGSASDAGDPNSTDPGYTDTTGPDGNDQCPNDPNKSVPGLCGCGTPDVDEDSDGVVDCDENQDKQPCRPLDETVDLSKEPFANQLCCLCENCELLPEERYYRYLDSHQLSCANIEFDTFGVEPGSETCSEIKREYREICCNAECTLPPAVEQEWEPAESPFPQGNYPTCHLCKPGDGPNGQYPLNPYTITAVAYIPGNPTCADLYWMGRTGNLPEAMCYPIQNFMLEPCGCSPPVPADRPPGDKPWCDICPGGQYPLRLGAFLNDLPGNPMCLDLYWMGRTGNISSDLCEQVHEKAQDACGCLPAA